MDDLDVVMMVYLYKGKAKAKAERYIAKHVGKKPYMDIKQYLEERLNMKKVDVLTFRRHLFKWYNDEFLKDVSWQRESMQVLIENETSLDLIIDINNGHLPLDEVFLMYLTLCGELDINPKIIEQSKVDKLIESDTKARRRAEKKALKSVVF